MWQATQLNLIPTSVNVFSSEEQSAGEVASRDPHPSQRVAVI